MIEKTWWWSYTTCAITIRSARRPESAFAGIFREVGPLEDVGVLKELEKGIERIISISCLLPEQSGDTE
jgi:hypothetical protein